MDLIKVGDKIFNVQNVKQFRKGNAEGKDWLIISFTNDEHSIKVTGKMAEDMWEYLSSKSIDMEKLERPDIAPALREAKNRTTRS